MVSKFYILALSILTGSALSVASSVSSASGVQPTLVNPTPMKTGADDASSNISGSLSEVFAQINAQEPLRRAGLRASVLRQVQFVVPIVVVVEDADSYLVAIENWEGAVRYPILWDDGSLVAREHIARFVRAFKPSQVIRISDQPDEPWGGSEEHRQGIFEKTLTRAIDQASPGWQSSLDQLGKEGIVSPGMVFTNTRDSAWAGALALCAGRIQPVVFLEKPSSPPQQPMSMEDADRLEREIERAARTSNLNFADIGDDIDAITLAMNTGTMIKTGPGPRDRLATTDRIGRLEAGGTGQRWAWAGQIIGNEAAGVYQAMCALFLTIDQGFVWDGYNEQQPWATYDGTLAAQNLELAGIKVELHDQPRYTMNDWKLRMVRPVGLIDDDETTKAEHGTALVFLMNSKGASNVFDLPGAVDGQGKPGHLPMLEIPAALHIVHSFSLQRPLNRDTVGGRLIERGVYVYAGSVDEPFLSAFVPTPDIALRLAGSLPFGAAVRFDNSNVWKVAVLGDPLVTVGPAGRRVQGEIKVDGSVDLDMRSKERLKDGDYEGAIQDLAMLGSDQAVARLAIALLQDNPESLTPSTALSAIPSLFRVGEYTKLVDAFERLDAMGREDGLMQDLLWLCSPYLLARAAADPDEGRRIAALLRSNIRTNQSMQDAEDLAMFLRKESIETAVGVLESLRPTLTKNQEKLLDRAIARVRR